jgi:hypothetical protein
VAFSVPGSPVKRVGTIASPVTEIQRKTVAAVRPIPAIVLKNRKKPLAGRVERRLTSVEVITIIEKFMTA